jgi:general secretion pathway protein M
VQGWWRARWAKVDPLRAKVEAWLGTLSPRERVMVSAAAAAVAIFAIFVIATGISRGVAAREARIEEKTKVLSQVGKLAAVYRAAQGERQALEARLKGRPVQLMSHVAQTGASLGIEVNDLRPTGAPVETEGLVEEAVEVNLARMDMPRLARLVQALEGGPGLVKVRRIRISTRSDDPKLVDVTLVVSTFGLKT